VRRGTAIVGSVVAHAAALIALARWAGGEHAQPVLPSPLEPQQQPVVTLVPIEVTLLDAPTAAREAPAQTGSSRGGIAIRAAHGPTPSGSENGSPDVASPRAGRHTHTSRDSVYMHMRRPSLFRDSDFDAILDHPLDPPPAVVRSGRLESAPGGRAAVRDAVATVSVDEDGSTHVHDTPYFTIHFNLPTPREIRAIARELKKQYKAWEADPWAETHRAGPTAEQPVYWRAQPGQCDRWGDWMCNYDPVIVPNREAPVVQVAKGRFDPLAWLARKHGIDEYASRKRALLDMTRAERVDRGGAFRSQQLARSAEIAHKNLERLWASEIDPAARKRALFELWDECAEGDDAAGEAGARARAEVIGWIRAHLPRGSAGAYTDDEIATLTARRTSKEAFAPY
jgi:hypothetical protein